MRVKQDSNLVLSRNMKAKQDSNLVLSRNRNFELLNWNFELLNQNISYINEFYRVNLNVINKGMITFNDFLNAFLKSANIENEINHNEWMENWKNIEKQILLMKIPIENIEQQSIELWKIIKSKQLVSHSDIYRAAYSPHYRLISSAQFQRLGLNLSERRKIDV